MPRIELYKVRSFGDKLNATFDFVKENWRPLIKFLTYILLPFSMLACLFIDTTTTALINFSYSQIGEIDGMFIIKYLLFLLLFVLSSIALYASVYSMLQLYSSRPERLQGLTFGEFKSSLLRNCKRILIISILSALFIILLLMIVIYAAITSYYSLIITIPALFAVILPLTYWYSSYLLEDISIIDSFKKAYRLGFPTWGGILLIMIVMGLIIQIIATVFSIPWYICLGAKALFFQSAEGGGVPVWINFASYLASVINVYFSIITSSLGIIALAYQYGHAADKIDGVAIDKDIENFENL